MTVPAAVQRVFAWKVRGIRWVEIIGVALVALMVLAVYVAKAAAARQSSDITDMERQIAANGERVRLLSAEVARLEQPARLETLSREAGLGPVDVHRQATEQGLPLIAPEPDPRPVVISPSPAGPAAVTEEPVEAPATPAEDAQ